MSGAGAGRNRGQPPGLTPGNTEHRVLFGVAYGMLGSVHDAEDVLQDTAERWFRLSVDEQRAIRVPAAWLRTVVVRRCLDLMKGQARQRERYRGIWLPEPRLSPEGASQNTPAEAVERAEGVSFALVLAMETLTPVERVSFVLHESFGVPFVEIAETVGRSVESCRQAARSARKRMAGARELSPDLQAHENARAAFVLASATGNLDALIGILDPSARVRSDGGASVKAALRPIVGADRVAGYLLGLLAIQRTRRDGLRFLPCRVNGLPGLLIRDSGGIIGVIDIAVSGRKIREIAIQVNPEKIVVPAELRGSLREN